MRSINEKPEYGNLVLYSSEDFLFLARSDFNCALMGTGMRTFIMEAYAAHSHAIPKGGGGVNFRNIKAVA